MCDRLRICMWSCFGDESRQGGSFGDEEVFWLGESVEKDRLVLGGGGSLGLNRGCWDSQPITHTKLDRPITYHPTTSTL